MPSSFQPHFNLCLCGQMDNMLCLHARGLEFESCLIFVTYSGFGLRLIVRLFTSVLRLGSGFRVTVAVRVRVIFKLRVRVSFRVRVMVSFRVRSNFFSYSYFLFLI